jgi:hypothetical protein
MKEDVQVSIVSEIPSEHEFEDEIIGYVEPWIASPGQTDDVKVSRIGLLWISITTNVTHRSLAQLQVINGAWFD